MCPDCHHNDHAPGRCTFDNCGASSVAFAFFNIEIEPNVKYRKQSRQEYMKEYNRKRRAAKEATNASASQT